MDKLINIKIENNALTFTVDTDLDLSNYSMEVFIDEACNIKNILQDGPEHNISIGDLITIDTDNNVTVTNSDAILPLDWNMKYITFRCYSYQTGEDLQFHGIFYVPEIIYDAEIRKLNAHCSTCLDDKMMQTLMLVVFKRQLLEYALQTDHFKDAIQLYLDICRLLDVSLNCSKGDCKSCSCILAQNSKCISTECDKCLCTESDCNRTCKTGTFTKCYSDKLAFSINLSDDSVRDIRAYGSCCKC